MPRAKKVVEEAAVKACDKYEMKKAFAAGGVSMFEWFKKER